jgi:hypothetical protein
MAEGANPDTDPARRLRARALSSRRARRRVAARLRWLAAEARQPTHSTWAVVPPLNHRELEEARESLLMLADRLELARKPCPRALALASFLIHDPFSRPLCKSTIPARRRQAATARRSPVTRARRSRRSTSNH